MPKGVGILKTLNITALTIVIIGAINWLLIGLFQYDIIAAIFGGQADVVSRIIYAVVGIAGLWCLSLYGYLGRQRYTEQHT